jgi:group I intron endonuclease
MKFNISQGQKEFPGVYKITCLSSGKIYIGSTKNFWTRYLSHVRQLKTGSHHNTHLLRSFQKHGLDNFLFESLEIVEELSKLRVREQYWIVTSGCLNRETGYNISPTTDMTEISEETKRRMSESHKGKPRPWLRGRTLSQERRNQVKEQMHSQYSDTEFRQRMKTLRSMNNASERHKQTLKENGKIYNTRMKVFKELETFQSMVKDYIRGMSLIPLAEKYGCKKSAIARIFSDKPAMYSELLIKIGFEGTSIKDLRLPEVQAKLILD